MNIDKRDALDAENIANACNLKGVANSMLRMLDNAVDLNLDYLGHDVAVDWIRDELMIIINEKVIGSHYPYPYTLRPHIFEATKKLYQMAYMVEYRNAPMSYPPLTIAAQALANITNENSYYERIENEIGIVPHSRMEEIENATARGKTVTIGDESFFIRWFDVARDECEVALR